ncbi:MAG: extracellular solute-binding protein [Cyanobacteria bacterium P01_E01_bin.34]
MGEPKISDSLDGHASAFSRRQLLQGLAVSGAALALGGCGSVEAKRLDIITLRSTFPGSIRRDFGAVSPLPTSFFPVDNRSQLFQILTPLEPSSGGLSGWLGSLQRAVFPPPQILSLSLLGSGWFDAAIAQNLLIPLADSEFPASVKDRLPPVWQQATLRQEKLWGLPWNWGVTAIAYDRTQVSAPIEDWEDLWRSELAKKVALPDSPREVVGLTLKSLGQSYNSSLADVDAQLGASALVERLVSLNAQALTYSSEDYLPALLLGDAAAVVGWSSDLYQLARVDRRFEVVIPKSGTALWWDVWVLPRQLNVESDMSELQELAQAWFEFLLSGDIPRRSVVTSRQPIPIDVPLDQLPDGLQTRLAFQPGVLEKGELLQPLGDHESRRYLELWRQMRAG